MCPSELGFRQTLGLAKRRAARVAEAVGRETRTAGYKFIDGFTQDFTR
jgi:hypothetical protein